MKSVSAGAPPSSGHRFGQCGRGDPASYRNDVVASCRHRLLLTDVTSRASRRTRTPRAGIRTLASPDGERRARRSSPADTQALSRWAKVLMMIQSSISLTVIVLPLARAVNIL